MIRGIIFDCFGVLYRGSIGHLYELAPESKREALANLSLSSDYGYLSRRDFLEQASEIIGISVDELQAIMQSDHVRNDRLVEYVKTLRPQYKVALLSNVGRGVIDQLFTNDELATLFDEVVLSSEVGMIKPDPNIFNITATRLGLLPEECVMIDDLVSNTDAAMSVNMKYIVFSTTDSCISDVTEILSVSNGASLSN